MVRQIEETENSIAQLGKTKISLTTQLEDTKKLGDAEARDKAALMSKFKNLSSELDTMRERIEEESEQKAEILKQLSKAQAEKRDARTLPASPAAPAEATMDPAPELPGRWCRPI